MNGNPSHRATVVSSREDNFTVSIMFKEILQNTLLTDVICNETSDAGLTS